MSDQSSSAIGANAADWLGRMFRRNPEGVLLMGAGLALLMRSGSVLNNKAGSGSAAAVSAGVQGGPAEGGANGGPSDGMLNRAADRAQSFVGSASEAAKSYVDSATTVAQSYADGASAYVDKARDTVSEQAARLKERSQGLIDKGGQLLDQSGDFVKQGSDFVRERPLAIAALGIGAGMAIAALLPATEIENRVVGPVLDKAADSARGVGSRVARATSAAGDGLAQSIGKRGMNESGVKEIVHEIADSFTGALADHDQAQTQGQDQSSGQPQNSGTGRENRDEPVAPASAP